jgi:hypothetical protein
LFSQAKEQLFPVGTNALTATEDGDFTAAFLDARCGHF